MMTELTMPWLNGLEGLAGELNHCLNLAHDAVGQDACHVIVIAGNAAPQVVRGNLMLGCDRHIICGEDWPGWNYKALVIQIALSGDEHSVTYQKIAVDLKELGYEDHDSEAGCDQRPQAGPLQPQTQDQG